MYAVWFKRNGESYLFMGSIESYALATRVAANLADEFDVDTWVEED